MTTKAANNAITALLDHPRLMLTAHLKPLGTDRFQPTGFPDLGAAVYDRPVLDKNGELERTERMLLVESNQSMANRLEGAVLDGRGPHLMPELKGLPYVQVKLTGDSDVETSSLVEAHRLNSPFIMADKKFAAAFADEAGYDPKRPIDWKKVAAAFFRYDPNSLLHGSFMAGLAKGGRVRVPRALSAFIEAREVREVASGGVKNEYIDATGKLVATEKVDGVHYGNVPFQRSEFTAAAIEARFVLDVDQIVSYGLPEAATNLLVGLALLKVRRLLDRQLRLRTACDLELKDDEVTVDRPKEIAWKLPEEKDLLAAVQEAIATCAKEKGLFANPPVTQISTATETKSTS